MAISASNLTGAGSSTNASSYTTASITPSSNALVLCAIETDISGTPVAPTITGCSLTWVKIADCAFDQSGTQYMVSIFRALGASPTSGALTIDYGGVTQAGCSWVVDQFSGVDTTGTNGSGAIVQSAKTAEPASSSTTSITATLGSAITSGNAAWTVACWEAAETGTAEAGWTGVGAGSHSGPSAALKTSWRNSNSDNSATTSWTTSSLAGAHIVEIKAGAAATYGLAMRDWRWYTDSNATVASGDALAAVSTTPTLSGAQMANYRLRLRVQLKELNGVGGTTSALKLQYSQGGSSWVTIEPTASPFTPETAVSNNEGVWFRYGDGLGTIGNTITSVLSGSTVAGKYHEDQQATESITASATHEVDFTIYVHYPPPDITLQFRISDGATGLAADTSYSLPSLTMSTAANRGNTVVYMDPDTSTKVGRELRFGPWNRVFYESAGANWWLFTNQFATGTVIRSYRWDGSAASWTAGATYTSADTINTTRHAFAMKTIGGVPVVWAHTGTSTTLRYYNRGTISGTTLTWGTEASVSQASARHNHICIDDGNFVWLVGIQSGGGGLYARRSTNADTGASWTTGWQTASTITDANALAGNIVTAVPLASNKILVVWFSGTPGTSGTLKWATVQDGTGWSSANNVDSSTNNHPEDWGIVRNGSFVYLTCTDSATGSPGGATILRIYSISSPPSTTWTLGSSPGVSGTPSNDDGIPLTANGSGELYAFWTGNGPESGQDRAISVKRYRYAPGSESSGTWDAAFTITPAAARGNADTMAVPPATGGGKLLVLWLFGDDSQGASSNLATGFAAEFFTAPILSLSATSASSTPDVSALPVARGLSRATASASSTNDTTALAVARGLILADASTSATPEIAALGVARGLAAAPVSASATPDTPALPIARSLGVSASSTTTTADTAALLRELLMQLAASSASGTPDTPTLLSLIALALAPSSASAAPDTVTLPIDRALALANTSASTTPDTIELLVSGLIELALSRSSSSATPDTASLPVARALALAADSLSSAPDAAGLLRALAYALGCSSASTTPDTATLIATALLALTLSLSSASTAPDTLQLPIARGLAAAGSSLSSTSDTAALPIARGLGAAASSASTTPDTVALLRALAVALSTSSASGTSDAAALLRELARTLSIASASATPDAIGIPVARSLTLAAFSDSATAAAALAIARALSLLLTSGSLTQDAANLVTALIEGLISVAFTASHPGVTMAAAAPRVRVSAQQPAITFEE